jgi:hypothetical protein
MSYTRTSLLHRISAISLTAGVLLLAGQAFADTTDWSLAPGGLYTSVGADGVLTGTNIPSLSVTGDGTPLDNGASLLILDGFLNFTSGSFDGSSSVWSWGAGGVLDLTGCIAGVTAAVCTGSNNVALISDDFQSVQIESVLGSLDVVFGNITGTLNAQVAAYFGVSTEFETASFETTLVSSGSPATGLTGTNLLGVIKATPATSVPEPWSIVDSTLFLVLALLVLAAFVRVRIPGFAQVR